MDAARFSSEGVNRLLNGNDVTYGRDLFQNVQSCLTDPMLFSVTF